MDRKQFVEWKADCSRPQPEAGLGLHLYQHSPWETEAWFILGGPKPSWLQETLGEFGAGGAQVPAQVDVGVERWCGGLVPEAASGAYLYRPE